MRDVDWERMDVACHSKKTQVREVFILPYLPLRGAQTLRAAPKVTLGRRLAVLRDVADALRSTAMKGSAYRNLKRVHEACSDEFSGPVCYRCAASMLLCSKGG